MQCVKEIDRGQPKASSLCTWYAAQQLAIARVLIHARTIAIVFCSSTAPFLLNMAQLARVLHREEPMYRFRRCWEFLLCLLCRGVDAVAATVGLMT